METKPIPGLQTREDLLNDIEDAVLRLACFDSAENTAIKISEQSQSVVVPSAVRSTPKRLRFFAPVPHMQGIRKAAVAFCILFTVFFSVTALSIAFTPDIIPGILSLYVEKHDTYAEITPDASLLSYDIPEDWHGFFYPSYIPDSYQIIVCDSHESADIHTAIWADADDNQIVFHENTNHVFGTINTEEADERIYNVHDLPAHLWVTDLDMQLIWSEYGKWFIVLMDGNNIEETLRIARSIYSPTLLQFISEPKENLP